MHCDRTITARIINVEKRKRTNDRRRNCSQISRTMGKLHCFEQTSSTKLQRARFFVFWFVRWVDSIDSKKLDVSIEHGKRGRRERGEVVSRESYWLATGRSSVRVFARGKRKFAAPSVQTPTAPKDSNFPL